MDTDARRWVALLRRSRARAGFDSVLIAASLSPTNHRILASALSPWGHAERRPSPRATVGPAVSQLNGSSSAEASSPVRLGLPYRRAAPPVRFP